MKNKRPKLTLNEQIEYLKSKGVKFNLMDEQTAKDYLLNYNNYLKATAYGKNYQKHIDGCDCEQYVDLEFEYLVDMAEIDRELRYQIVDLALDVEHYTKIEILRKVEFSKEDGYDIVKAYMESLSPAQERRLNKDISRNKETVYCENIAQKYKGVYPVWVFIDIVTFGTLVDFYGFCGDYFNDRKMKDGYHRLHVCKNLRNAAAHNNCILDDLRSGTAKNRTDDTVTQALSRIPGISKGFRTVHMKNENIQEVVTLLYTHKEIVGSRGIHTSESRDCHDIIRRMFKNIHYYENNNVIKSSFEFLKIIIDNWFKID